jgi:hypothetical protein
MSTIAISSLPVVTTGLVGDVIPIVQSGVTSQITNANLFNSVTTLTVNGMAVGRGTGTNTSSVAIGNGLSANTTGTDNVAIGTTVLANNNSGSQNIGIGTLALLNNTNGIGNLAIGYVAQRLRTSGSYNVGLGDNALYNNLTSSFNTAVGAVALFNVTTGSNTAVGYQSGYLITTGTKNTILGRYTGNQGGLDIRTLSNYIVLSDGDGNPRAYWNGADATFSGSLTLPGTIATSAVAATVPSGSTITPLKAIAFISGTTVVNTISVPSNMLFTGGTITLIPTGAFTWTTAGNIALAGTAVVSKALIMTYDYGTGKWYPSYT